MIITNPIPDTRRLQQWPQPLHPTPAQRPGLAPSWTVLLTVFFTLLFVLLLFRLCTGVFNSRLLFVGLLYTVLALIGAGSATSVLLKHHEACQPTPAPAPGNDSASHHEEEE